MRLILPKTLCKIDPTYGPLFFLAGLIRGGGDWQMECCIEIRKCILNFYVALPCRYLENHPLMAFRLDGDEDCFDRQLTWERYYLEMAADFGCLIFWLPREDRTNPRVGYEPYAMDTLGELGEWRGRLMYDSSLRIVIGAEPGFPGLSQIQRNFNLATRSEFPIYGTLDETVVAAVKKIS
jgi:hypothetical protein